MLGIDGNESMSMMTRRKRMTDVRIYDRDAEKLNEASAKIGESIATVIEWLIEENLDALVESEVNK